ncbi:helix-turn-helix transcriptional regulator [Candidatus Saccharibacteria bacterium]|nr:helix-turn-helix transcriptional regulator [Candidatus Saccharibacteria bacterium]
MENNEAEKYFQIGGRIKAAREAEGMTQSELAQELGYKSPTAISLIEAGERRVQISDLEAIAKLLHRDVSYFIKGEDAATQNQPSVQIALRADKQLDQDDIKRVESFIDALKLSKKPHGRSDTTNR